MSEPITPEISDRICQHMNEDHSDAIILYAKVFGNLPQVNQAQLLSIDPLGMDIKVDPSHSDQPLRIEFDHPLQDAEEAHQTLITMVKQARQKIAKTT